MKEILEITDLKDMLNKTRSLYANKIVTRKWIRVINRKVRGWSNFLFKKIYMLRTKYLCKGMWVLMNEKKNEIVLFENQGVKLEVNVKDETVWLTQEQMSKLFKKAKSTINEHIKNIYTEGELIETETMTKFGNSEFADKPTNYYNLDMIISVGYRVKSQNGILFRKWATNRFSNEFFE